MGLYHGLSGSTIWYQVTRRPNRVQQLQGQGQSGAKHPYLEVINGESVVWRLIVRTTVLLALLLHIYQKGQAFGYGL